MHRIIGLGGVFVKAKNPKLLAAWYEKHLGLNFGENVYTDFPLSGKGCNVLSFFGEETKYLEPSASSFMFNFRVADLDELLKILQSEGVEILGEPIDEEYGKFAWITDIEGNKIELWQPPE
jgi:D-3-phosphoglycerate dehydrogenase / 2-oxoglutarate reductase